MSHPPLQGTTARASEARVVQGVSGAIKRRAGYQPFRELARHGPMPLGSAVLTSAGQLPHQGIIHVAGISMWWVASQQSIQRSVQSAMAVVNQHPFASVAFPVIGGGTGGAQADQTLHWMQEVLKVTPTQAEVRIVRYLPH